MRLRKDNQGSSIVTVLVVVAFMTILVTTLLYVSGMNFKTKQIDYQNKQSFYVSETAVEEMKARFILEASSAFEEAYKTTLLQYANKNAGERDELYKKTFVEAVQAQWEAMRVPAIYTNTEIMQNTFGLTPASQACVISVGGWDFNATQGYARLNDVVVSYTNAQGYSNMISTDFYMEAPDLDWSIDHSGVWMSGVDDSREIFQTEDFVIFEDWKRY